MKGLPGALVAALTFLAAPGCGGKTDSGFNDTLADIQSKLTASEKKLEDLIEFSLHKEEAQAKLKAASDEFGALVAESRTRFNAVTVPEGEAAKRFHAAFGDYLKIQEEAAPLYKALVDAAVAKKLDETGAPGESLRALRPKRQGIAQSLSSLQQAYAQEAGLKLGK